jgi:hypothetical protein
VVYGKFNIFPLFSKKGKTQPCALYGKGDVTIREWSACEPITHAEVLSCRKSEKH